MTGSFDAHNSSDRMLMSFSLGKQGYCIDVMCVREIRGWTPATLLPSAPQHVRGMVNLRGTVIPIIDLALRLGLQPTSESARSVVIVVEVLDRLVGLLVDAVSEILTVNDQDVQPPPAVGSPEVQRLIRGVLTVHGSSLLSWLDIEEAVPQSALSAAQA